MYQIQANLPKRITIEAAEDIVKVLGTRPYVKADVLITGFDGTAAGIIITIDGDCPLDHLFVLGQVYQDALNKVL